jgi:hypothetical protein
MSNLDTLNEDLSGSYNSICKKDLCHVIAEVTGSNPLPLTTPRN